MGGLRDPIIAWFEARMRLRQEEKQRRYLAKVEERRLRAQGVAQIDARQQAQKSAADILAQGYKIRRSVDSMRAAPTAPPRPSPRQPAPAAVATATPAPAPVVVPAQAGEEEEPRERATYLDRKYGGFWGLLLGSQARFIAGMVLLIPFLFWMYENNPHFLQEASKKGVETISGVRDQLAGESSSDAGSGGSISINDHPQSLTVQATPADKYVSRQTEHNILQFLGSYPCGFAGTILVVSALFGGKKMGVFMIAAVLLILCGGSLHVPTFGLVKPENLGMALGGIVAALGVLFGRDN